MIRNSRLPDMPESVEKELACSLIVESIRLESKRCNGGIFSPKIIEPFVFFIFGLDVFLFLNFEKEGEEGLVVAFIVIQVILIFYLAHVVSEDLATFRQIHITKILDKIHPLILKDVYDGRIKSIKDKINYSVFCRLDKESIIEHFKLLAPRLKWKHRLTLWFVRYLILGVGVVFLCIKFYSSWGTWIVMGLAVLCLIHISVLKYLASSPSSLKKTLNIYNKLKW